MRDNTPLAILWRRRWIVIATLLAFTVTTAVISKTLQRVYQAQATLLVVPSQNTASFDAAQAAQQVARTYGEIIGSRNVADLVAIKLADGTTGKQLVPNMAFEPIPETELLKITAEDPDPARAQRTMQAMLQMGKIEIQALEDAANS